MGDVQAVASGKPSRIVKRYVNKLIGRKIVSKLGGADRHRIAAAGRGLP